MQIGHALASIQALSYSTTKRNLFVSINYRVINVIDLLSQVIAQLSAP